MSKDYLEKGTYLSTLDGQYYSNGIVVGVVGNRITILTDFGNIIERIESEVFEFFKVNPSWIEAEHYDYPLPTLEQRIDEQINNLKLAKELLCEGVLDD